MIVSHKINSKDHNDAFVVPVRNRSPRALPDIRRSNEGGYTLVALLALMTIFAIFAMAVAPSIKQQNQRAKELEAIARGEEVAEAIRLYVIYKGTLPTSVSQLLEGVPRGTKKIQILRSEAARDPLSSSGEWKLVQKNNVAVLDFARAVTTYAGTPPPYANSQRTQILSAGIPRVTNILNLKSLSGATGDSTGKSSGDDSLTEGPFIGVVSRSKNASVIAYYGIDHHDGWLFTPAINPHCDASPTSCE
jgi:type II secretory pathway pseudopilin PulG